VEKTQEPAEVSEAESEMEDMSALSESEYASDGYPGQSEYQDNSDQITLNSQIAMLASKMAATTETTLRNTNSIY